ncbi:MAG: Wzz/FepE/Etk N-terminal domain-containing protein [Alistipes sp.]|nr:Wzz/FepE/Etk N-terminal domain-containing protein [Alistipes sp.]
MQEEIEIDLGLILRVLLGKIWIILLAGVVCGLSAFIVSNYILPEKFESTAQLYIINRQNEGVTTYTDIQTSTQLVKDYKVLVVSRPVVEQVISNLDLSLTTQELVKAVTVDIASDSRVLSVSVKSNDPYTAKQIVDNLADVSSERICDVMQIDGVNIIEYGNIPDKQSSPNVLKITLIGAAFGLFAACAVIIAIHILDDSIKTADDIEHFLGISTLALIPLSEAEYDGVESTGKKKNKKKFMRR